MNQNNKLRAYSNNTIGIEKIILFQDNKNPILLFINYKAMSGNWITSEDVLKKLTEENIHFLTEKGRVEIHSFKFRNRKDIDSFNDIMCGGVKPDVVNFV